MAHVHRQAPAWGAVSVVVVLVMAGFLFAANARISADDAREPSDLRSLVRAELDRADTAAQEVAVLRSEVDSLTDQQTGPESGVDSDPVVISAAGWVEVTGPGLEVRLSDAPAGVARPEMASNGDLVVHQQDLQAVVNALWAGGAEAMGLQDQRVVATSAFRCVGNVLILQGQTYSPPYVVRAIGDVDAMLDALDADPSIQVYLQYVDVLGLGWSVTEMDEIVLPAYDGPAELNYAQESAERREDTR
jgi:uncharacterized protein YlxW (UPF0749 family)